MTVRRCLALLALLVALVVADAMRLKFGGDSLDEALANYRTFVERNQ